MQLSGFAFECVVSSCGLVDRCSCIFCFFETVSWTKGFVAFQVCTIEVCTVRLGTTPATSRESTWWALFGVVCGESVVKL